MRAFQLDNFLDHGQRSFRRLPSAFDPVVRIKHAHNAWNARLRGPSAGIARKADRARSSAVIRTVTRYNLVASSKEARDLDGILVSFGATVGKEERINIARSDLRQLLS